MKKFLTKGVLTGILATTAMLATACPPPSSTPVNWSFHATQVTVNSSQDETCVLGICVNTNDEPYVLNVNFRVKIGVPGSASTWVSGSRSDSQSGMGGGSTHAVTGGGQATANFTNVVPLDVLDLTNPANHVEVLGSFVWALEEDTVGVGAAADSTATVLKDALNQTLAAGSLPSDLSSLLSIITSNLGSAFILLAQNIPLLGLGDDIMGGGMYVGIAAKGSLGDIINTSIATTAFPNIAIPIVSLPPDITRGGFYTTTGSKAFTGQSWSCCGGQHTWDFLAGPA